MQTSRFQAITARFSPHNLRTSFRRSLSTSSTSSSASSRASSTDRGLTASQASSPVSTINSIVFRQKSLLELHDEEEHPTHILEPRPAATFCSLEERMMSF
ncbi:57a77093-4475-4a26-9b76-4dee7e768bcd [Thermothielavioides terrestris]|uniref:Uncharacterized protein n=2 Tax=Thermothielavioides terrestris TaxID=2587410 RepID=G2R1X8_THETT|nr:uncharacterized protein THITE_2077110 [Thermothielavioides terrestris NRRL 8126]AEO65759.1 hypothetical protein THITE_2077110 [Thermothielavioides terrestris NRRL 8126]SPQ18981.1 57a77093-4475-4a26-9b76-4dee7e768bcd [Thermothielavioides terrestris]